MNEKWRSSDNESDTSIRRKSYIRRITWVVSDKISGTVISNAKWHSSRSGNHYWSHLIPCRKRIIIYILSPNASVRTRDVWVLQWRCASAASALSLVELYSHWIMNMVHHICSRQLNKSMLLKSCKSMEHWNVVSNNTILIVWYLFRN